MQQWEYCVIYGAAKDVRTLVPGQATLIYFTTDGARGYRLDDQTARPADMQQASAFDYFAHTIARLGLEGWELIEVANGSFAGFFFRRPLQP